MPVPSTLSLQQDANPEPSNSKAKEPTPEETSRPTSPSPPDSPRSNENKLFVGGLCWETKEETLKSFFSEYGDVLECSLMKDVNTKRSRGFAFITFKEFETVQKILDTHSKDPIKIDEKIIDPKLAVPRRGNKVRRIFIGGLSSDTGEEDMKEFFEKFGDVEEAQLMYDKQTNRHRGFGFITFENPEPAEKVCGIQFHDIKGKKVEVKVAQTKEALALQAGKARTAAYTHGYGTPYNYSPTYSPYYQPYPIDLYGPQVMLGNKPRGGNGANKMRLPNQFSPPAFFGGYGGYSPSDHNGHITSPQYFSGYPSPFFMRGPDPALPLGSPPIDFVEQFQALAMMGGPYTAGMSPGSPPNSIPVTINNSSFTYQNGMGGDSMGPNYSPPTGISPKGSPTGTPVNGYTQVPNNFATGKGSYPMQQTTA